MEVLFIYQKNISLKSSSKEKAWISFETMKNDS